MVDPGFLPGLIGAAVAEILHAVIKITGKAIMCKEYCRNLQKLLQPLEPVVKDIKMKEKQNQASISPAVSGWLKALYSFLQEASSVILECTNLRIWDLLARIDISNRILAVTKRLNELMQQMPLINLVVIVEQNDLIAQAIKRIEDEVGRLNLANSTQKCMTSETISKDRAFFEIKTAADRFTASSGTSVPNALILPTDESSSLLQPLPDFVFGIEEDCKRLEELLLENYEEKKATKWVGIWGMGGAGKTLIAHTVCNSPAVQAHFNGNIYRLSVGRDPRVEGLQGTLCDRIGCGRQIFDSKDDGKKKLFNYLLGRKSLLLLDDVWEPDLLDWLDVVAQETGSRILVTTRNEPVLQRVHAQRVRVDMLSEENSWLLFCRHAFNGEENMPEDLRSVVEQVVEQCKGLPLALKVIGGTMAGKGDVHEWESALGKLRDAVVLGREQEVELIQRLKISYDELEKIDSIRGKAIQECFLYFAAFPEDGDVEVEKLVEFWWGEKIVGYQDGGNPEDDAYFLLGLLVGRSLIELEKGWSAARTTKSLTICKIHDVLRDLALYILQHNKPTDDQECLFRAGKNEESFPEQWLTGGPARKMSLIGNNIQSLPSTRIRTPSLQVLLLSKNKRLAKIDGRFLQNFLDLRVLDLSRTAIVSLPEALGKLRRLVVLNLSYNGHIKSVPGSIGKLTKLEDLNLQQCSNLSSLPLDALSKLVNLQHLNTRGCAKVWDDQNLGCIRSCVVNCFERRHLSSLETLSPLTRLRKLWIGSSSHESLPRTMSRLVKLTLLSVYFRRLKHLPDELQSLVQLEVLDLNSCFELVMLPSWIPESLPLLKILDLRRCTRLSHELPALDKLQKLTSLDLSMCQSLTHLPQSFSRSGAFPALQELWLMACSKLTEFPEVQHGAFPRLSHLSLFDCYSLTRIPQSVQLLTSLRQLDLGGCKLLPDDQAFACFINLEELSLKNTLISCLPPSVVTLPAIKKLNISGCTRLENLPEVVGSAYFPNLEELVAKGTPISHLPTSLAALPRLRKLDVSDCDPALISSEDLREAFRRRNIQIQGI